MSCLNVYLPWSSDTLQAPKICSVLHRSLLHRVHLVSVVIFHLLRLVGDRSELYVEARQTEGSKISWHCHQRSPRKVLLNIVHASCALALNLQLDSFGDAISVIDCFVVDWNISLVMFWRFVFRHFCCGGISKPMPVMMAASTDLTDFYVIFTRQNSIFNLPSTSSKFRDADRN